MGKVALSDGNFSGFRQIVICILTYFTTLAPSMSIGFSAVALPALMSSLDPDRLSAEEASWVASIAAIATPIGCLLSGPLSDRYGRRLALLTVSCVATIGWTCITLAGFIPKGMNSGAVNSSLSSTELLALTTRVQEVTTEGSESLIVATASDDDLAAYSRNVFHTQRYVALLVGRFLTGLSTGLVSMPATVYMAEVASSDWRLLLTTAAAVAYSFGIFTVYVLGFLLPSDWHIIALISAGIAASAILVCLYVLPETPTWLIAHQRSESEVSGALCTLYRTDYVSLAVQQQLDELRTRYPPKVVRRGARPPSLVHHMRKKFAQLSAPNCARPMAVLVMFFAFQQFSGTFAIVFFAVRVVTLTGAQIDPYTGILLIGLSRLTMSILICVFSQRLGRRLPTIVSGVGMALAMAVLAAYTHYAPLQPQLNTPAAQTSNMLSWIPVAALVAYFLLSTAGFVSIPFAMAAELFPVKVRGVASGAASASAYVFNFMIVKAFDDALLLLGADGLFTTFGVVAAVGTVALWKWLPETRGRTLAQIEEYFVGQSGNNKNNEKREKPIVTSLEDVEDDDDVFIR